MKVKRIDKVSVDLSTITLSDWGDWIDSIFECGDVKPAISTKGLTLYPFHSYSAAITFKWDKKVERITKKYRKVDIKKAQETSNAFAQILVNIQKKIEKLQNERPIEDRVKEVNGMTITWVFDDVPTTSCKAIVLADINKGITVRSLSKDKKKSGIIYCDSAPASEWLENDFWRVEYEKIINQFLTGTYYAERHRNRIDSVSSEELEKSCPFNK